MQHVCFSVLSAFINARGASPPLALARRLRAALGPQALPSQLPRMCRRQSGTT